MRTISDIIKMRKAHKSDYMAKWYDDILAPYTSRNICLLEIGVQNGYSMQAWCDIFPNGTIFGIDCDEICLKNDVGRATIFIGKQQDKTFLAYLVKELPPLDIVIDDGGHHADGQQESFNALFYGLLKPGGLYVIEDLEVARDAKRMKDGYPCTIDFVAALSYKHKFFDTPGGVIIMATIMKDI